MAILNGLLVLSQSSGGSGVINFVVLCGCILFGNDDFDVDGITDNVC